MNWNRLMKSSAIDTWKANGRVMPYRELPPEAQSAIGHYMSVDGEAWGDDNPEWWGRSVQENLPGLVEQYGEKPFGYTQVPMHELTRAIMDSNRDVQDQGHDWDAYHQWYLDQGRRGMPDHDVSKPLWPVILSSPGEGFEGEVIQDGWHRLHDYYRKGVQSVPAVWYPEHGQSYWS